MQNVQSNPDRQTVHCAGYFSNGIHSGPRRITWENGRIVSIDSSSSAGEPLYAVPLLADTHVHVYMEPWPIAPALRTTPGSRTFEEEVADALVRTRHALECGIGFLRDMGDPLGINLEVKRRLRASGAPAPELQAPGPALHRPKKYGRFLGLCFSTVEEIKTKIDSLVAEHQVDYIKLVTTGIVNFEQKLVKQTPQFTPDELREVVDYAHSRGRKVACHCSGTDGLDIAIEAGVDFIEHAYFITDDQLRRLIVKGLHWTPTFAPVYVQGNEEECGWSSEVCSNISEILREHNSKIASAAAQDARILAGTDAGSPGVSMGEGLRMELSCLSRSGLTPERLLSMATVENAQACGAQSYTGLLAPGQAASFGLYRKAPWNSIDHLNTLETVYWNGQQITPASSTNRSAKLEEIYA